MKLLGPICLLLLLSLARGGEEAKTVTLQLPTRLTLDEKDRVVFGAEDREAVEVPARPDCTTLYRWYRDGERFRVTEDLPPGEPIDSWESHSGPVDVTYRLEVRQKRPREAFIVWKRDYRVARDGEKPAQQPLPEGAIRRLGTTRFRHPGAVDRVVFSPDGELVASDSMSWGGDRRVRVWDAASGDLLYELRGPLGPVFSPDGTLLATGRWPGATLWDARTGKKIKVLYMIPRLREAIGVGGLRNDISCVRFSPDGKFLAIGGRAWMRFEGETVTRQLVLLDLETGGEALQFTHDRPVRDVTFSEDGKLLTAVDDGGTKVWEVATGREVGDERSDSTNPWDRAPAVSPDGRVVAVSAGHTVRLYDREWGRPLALETGHFGPVLDARFSPGGEHVATASRDGTIRLWDVETDASRAFLRDRKHGAWSLSFSPDGKTLAATGAPRLLDAATGEETGPRTTPIWGRESVAWSPDGKTIAYGGRDGTVFLWDPATKRELRRWAPPGGKKGIAHSLVWSPDGKRLVAAGPEAGLAVLYDPGSEEPVRTLLEGSRAATAIAISPGGRSLLAVGDALRIVDLESGKVGLEVKGNWSAACGWSPDGGTLAAAESIGTVVLLDAATGKRVAEFQGHDGPVRTLDFSPDGKLLVSGCDDTTALIWKVTAPAGAGDGR